MSDVFVFQDGCDYLVRPATFVVGERRTVTFRNLTTSTVAVFLPWRVGSKESAVVTLAPTGAEGEILGVEVGELRPAAWSYAAFVMGPNVFAKGHSEPRVIIDR